MVSNHKIRVAGIRTSLPVKVVPPESYDDQVLEPVEVSAYGSPVLNTHHIETNPYQNNPSSYMHPKAGKPSGLPMKYSLGSPLQSTSYKGHLASNGHAIMMTNN